MDRKPLVIVGAGPAGLSAAIYAARRDVPVVVRERQAVVGGRFRDDFQGLENWTSPTDVLDELAAAGIEPSFEHIPIREQVCFDPAGRSFTFRSPTPFYYLVRRGPAAGTLDTALRDQALRAGVVIRFQDPVEQLPADGVVARGPRGGDTIAAGFVFDTDAADGCYGVMDDRLAPKGYAYLLIHRGRGTLATCMFAELHEARRRLERTVAYFQERLGVGMRHPRHFGGLGALTRRPALRAGGLVFAGEAAGLQDALWGFGIRYAVRSGWLAARRVTAPADRRGARRAERQLERMCRAGRVNRFIYERLGNPGYAVFLRLMSRARDPRDWLAERYAPSLTKTLLAVAARI